MSNVNTKVKKKNNKGFTLIELLATLAILSIIFTIVIYFASNIINNSKEKSYKVTINNVEKSAKNYISENNDSFSWRELENNNDYQYQCITVRHLMEKGYFDSDILESKVNDDIKVSADNYIYIERNKESKSIRKEMLLHNGMDEALIRGLCGNINASGNISFNVIPLGKVYNGYSKEKEITINYRLYNVSGNLSGYNYNYEFNENIKTNDTIFESVKMGKKLTIDKNGVLIAKIKKDDTEIDSKSLVIEKIDNIGPVITHNYEGDKFARKSVIIPLKVADVMPGSGVNADSFTKDDIKVTIGGIEITNIELDKKTVSDLNSEVTYELTINDSSHKGQVEIVIGADKVEDNLENKNIETKLTPDITFITEYNVIYYLGDGTSVANSTQIGKTTCTYGEDCTLKKFSDFGKDFPLSSGSSADNYWSFDGWIIGNLNVSQKDYTKKDYTDGEKINIIEIIENDTIKLYAIGKKTFNFYSGINPSSSNKTLYQYWNPHSTNANYLTSITIPKSTDITGWTFIGYKGGSNGTNSSVDYASSKVGTTVKPAYDQYRYMRSKYSRTISIEFDPNGGTGTMNPLTGTQIYNSGTNNNGSASEVSFNLPTFGFKKIGSSPISGKEWKSRKTNNIYKDKQTGVKIAPAVDNDSVEIFDAQWRINKVYVQLDTNGGTIKSNTTYDGINYTWSQDSDGIISRQPEGKSTSNKFFSISYGSEKDLPNWNGTYMNISRTGYAAIKNQEWKCLSDNCANDTYDHTVQYSSSELCDASNGDCTIVLGVNWKVSTYSVTYDANGGTSNSVPANQEKIYGNDLTLSNAKPTRTGYTFTGWNTKADGSGDKYSAGGTYKENEKATLYAQWRINKVYVQLDTNGGTIKSSTTYDGIKYTWTTNSSGIISRQPEGKSASSKFFYINYGAEKKLPNWNGTYMNITRLGYIAKNNAEWKCLSGCSTSDATFNHDEKYSSNKFCSASKGDCTVILGVNWTTVTKYVNAKSGLNCRSTPSSANSKNIVSGKAKSCGSSVKGAVVSGNDDWFYVPSTGCYHSNDYLVSSSSAVTKCSTPSTPSTPSNPTPSTPSTPTIPSGSVGVCGSCSSHSDCKSTAKNPGWCYQKCWNSSTASYYSCCGLKGYGGVALPQC